MISLHEFFGCVHLYIFAQVLVEFYNSLCPVCQRFAPIYEEVGDYFSRVDVVPPVTVIRVDCKKFVTLCAAYEIRGVPKLLFGQPEAALVRDLAKMYSIAARKTEGIIEELSVEVKAMTKRLNEIQLDTLLDGKPFQEYERQAPFKIKVSGKPIDAIPRIPHVFSFETTSSSQQVKEADDDDEVDTGAEDVDLAPKQGQEEEEETTTMTTYVRGNSYDTTLSEVSVVILFVLGLSVTLGWWFKGENLGKMIGGGVSRGGGGSRCSNFFHTISTVMSKRVFKRSGYHLV